MDIKATYKLKKDNSKTRTGGQNWWVQGYHGWVILKRLCGITSHEKGETQICDTRYAIRNYDLKNQRGEKYLFLTKELILDYNIVSFYLMKFEIFFFHAMKMILTID
jgi:hypothetical protein